MQRFGCSVLGWVFWGKDNSRHWKKDWKKLRSYQVSGEPSSQTRPALGPFPPEGFGCGADNFFYNMFPKGSDNCFLFSASTHWANQKITHFLGWLLIQPESGCFSFPGEKAGFLPEPIETFLLEDPRFFMQYLLWHSSLCKIRYATVVCVKHLGTYVELFLLRSNIIPCNTRHQCASLHSQLVHLLLHKYRM